jgi:alkylation response protein AidB-like acyl-CoA dehydrogenase
VTRTTRQDGRWLCNQQLQFGAMTSMQSGKVDPMGIGIKMLHRLAGATSLDRLGLRRPTERAVFQATKAGFRTAGVVNRTFSSRAGTVQAARPVSARSSGLFDLTPTEDQQMMVDVVSGFARDVLRPAARQADDACMAPETVMAQGAGLGLNLIGVSETFGGVVDERSATTGLLVAEALAHGDMGLAVACLAPSAVSTAISLWGTAEQQATYLPEFTGDEPPVAALAIQEPRALFDPFALATTARRTPDGWRLDGVKSMVPRGAEAELLLVAAELDDADRRGPCLFLVESGRSGLTVEAEPAMGLRAAAMSRVFLDGVAVPETALLGAGAVEDYRACVRASRLAWAGLGLGTARAVLDYVTPYVNEREAFGEPVSHRQSVAFMVADIATELEGIRLVAYRAASRTDHGMDAGREVALARRLCAEHGMQIGVDGVQLLGGHGFVKEHPVERWYRDLRAVGLLEGGVLV